jgi:hypothetical protein
VPRPGRLALLEEGTHALLHVLADQHALLAAAVSAQADASSTSAEARSTSRDNRTASGALAAMRAASATASATASPSAQTWLTRPWRCAASTPNGSPVNTYSIARFAGIRCPRRKRPPAPAIRPRRTSGSPNVAAGEATTRSQLRTSSVPPASAGPSTAAISGLVRARRTSPPNPPRSVESSAASPAARALRSAPAQKTGGAPVSTPARSSSSASRRSIAASMPWATAGSMALRASGRTIVITATRSRMVKSMGVMDARR